ncbi:hypothetical protein EVAR_62092_1 [Eumeta japonica]|uniref:Uncharacterized protein n=1 Tax=Eumeta variegata TaxID=151549 RepID=A0A4C1Z1F0_EUMVA|nr:hypothetical protein EVAR_62092_1 [Eumeta japonica]
MTGRAVACATTSDRLPAFARSSTRVDVEPIFSFFISTDYSIDHDPDVIPSFDFSPDSAFHSDSGADIDSRSCLRFRCRTEVGLQPHLNIVVRDDYAKETASKVLPQLVVNFDREGAISEPTTVVNNRAKRESTPALNTNDMKSSPTASEIIEGFSLCS